MSCQIVLVCTAEVQVNNTWVWGVRRYSTSDSALDALIDESNAAITLSNLYSSNFKLVAYSSDNIADFAQYTFYKV